MITRRGLIKAGLVGAGMISHGNAITNVANAAVTSGVVARVGAQTFAGIVILTLQDENHNPLTGVSVTGGTTTPAAYDLSSAGVLSVASNGSMAGEDGNTITYTSDQGDGAITLAVDDSKMYNWTVTDYATMGQAYLAALNDLNFLASGDAQIILKDGDYHITYAGYFKNRSMLNTLTFRAENPSRARFTNVTDIYNADNYIFDGIYFKKKIQLQFGSDNISFIDTEHHNADVLTASDAYAASPGGPQSIAIWGLGDCSNVTIQRAKIYGWGEGIVCGQMRGPLVIDGCEITNVFEDAIKIGGGFPVTITDNTIETPVAAAQSFGDPHADPIQFLGNREHDWEDILIARNIIYAKHTDRSNQGIFLDDMGAGYYYSGTRILGNVLVNVGASTTGIRVSRAKDIEVIGNTVVSHLGTIAHGPGIVIGELGSAGMHIIKNNVADVINIAGASTMENNVTLGIGGARIPYTAAFTGTAFAPMSRDDVLAEFAMQPNGSLDKGGNVNNVGAIASGYVTFPATSPGNGGVLGDA